MHHYLKKSVFFAFLHSLFFLLLLLYFRPIPGVDIPENFAWGMNFDWGYAKHPPLFAWVQEVFAKIFGVSVFTAYLTAFCFVFASLVIVFFLAKEFLGERKAFFVVLLLEALSFSSINARVFNANLVQVPLWILSALFYYYGITAKTKIKQNLYFILFGAFLGLSFLGKYFTLLLAFVIFVSFVSNKKTRDLLKTPAPFLAVFTFIIIIMPHIIWLLKNDFTTLKYIQEEQITNYGFLAKRLKFAGSAFLLNILTILPVILFTKFTFKLNKFKKIDFSDVKQNFLFCISVLPFAILMFVSFVFGVKVLIKWSITFFFWLPIFLLYFFNAEELPNTTKKMYSGVIFFAALFAIIAITSGIKDDIQKKNYYENIKEIVKQEDELWYKEFGFYPKIIIGNIRESAAYSMFSKNRPIAATHIKESYLKPELLKKYGYISMILCTTEKDCNIKANDKNYRLYKTKFKKEEFYIQIIYTKPL